MNYPHRWLKLEIVSLSLLAATEIVWAQPRQASHPRQLRPELYRSNDFIVTDTSVRQGRYEAIALSRDTIVSTGPR